MVTPERYRELALSLPHAVQGSHFESMDFRVGGRIFATWREDKRQAVVKLTPDDQRLFMETMADVVSRIPGGWGLKGWSRVDLDAAAEKDLRHILAIAWRTVAPARLRKDG